MHGVNTAATEARPVLGAHFVPAMLVRPALKGALPRTAVLRFDAAMVASAAVQAVAVVLIARRTGADTTGPADVFTLLRSASAGVLLALVATGRAAEVVRPTRGLLLGAMATDVLDGPLARAHGATPAGPVLDIEADSLLTLSAACFGVAAGRLPWLSLAPPVFRYRDPILALGRKELPAGGGPWWARISGAAQMLVFVAALGPGPAVAAPGSRRIAEGVAAIQLVSQVVDGRRRNGPSAPFLAPLSLNRGAVR